MGFLAVIMGGMCMLAGLPMPACLMGARRLLVMMRGLLVISGGVEMMFGDRKADFRHGDHSLMN